MPSAHCILVDAPRRRVWVVPGAKGWALPEVAWDVPEDIEPCVNVGYLRRALEQQWSLAVTVLYGYAVRDDEADEGLWLYAVECRGAASPARDGAWMTQADLARRPPDRRFFGPLLADFFAEAVDGDGCVEPWCQTGFAAAAEAWIRAQCAGPVRIDQSRQWYRGAVWRVADGERLHYFKACPAHLRQEVPVVRHLSARFPQWIPPAVASDSRRGWLLSRDSGGRSLAACADIAVWEEGLRAYARMQRACVDQVPALRAEVPDWSLPVMAASFPDLLQRSDRLLAGGPHAFAANERAELRRRAPQVLTLCRQATECGVPHTLEHCDIYYSDNMHRTERGFAFFDWAEACITHPFTGFMYFLMVDEQFPGPGAAERFRSAYLSMWTDCAPMGDLRRLMTLMPALRHLQESFHYARQVESTIDRAPEAAGRPYSYAAWTLEQTQSWLAHFLRQLSGALQELEAA